MSYVRDGRDNLKEGLDFEKYVADLFIRHLRIPLDFCPPDRQEYAENPQGIEVKWDGKMKDTGRIFIEYQERKHALSGPGSVWRGAGILSSAWALAIGDRDMLFVLGVRELVELWQWKEKDKYKYRRVETDTAKGFLLPVRDAERIALFFLPPPIKTPFSQRALS